MWFPWCNCRRTILDYFTKLISKDFAPFTDTAVPILLVVGVLYLFAVDGDFITKILILLLIPMAVKIFIRYHRVLYNRHLGIVAKVSIERSDDF
jgi:hypothetical protein